MISLLTAAESGEYRQAAPEDCKQLLRVIAYLRKDDDAIPDSLRGGFADDQDLMRLVCGQLKPELDRYKSWHLACRVPLLWQAANGATSHPFAASKALGRSCGNRAWSFQTATPKALYA